MSVLPFDMNYMAYMDANKEAENKESLVAGTTNGSTFKMNQAFEVTIKMQQPDYVADFKNGYFSMDITNGCANANTASFQGYVGSLGLINQQIIKTDAGKEFSNIDGYNVLTPLLIEKIVDPDWYSGNGNILFGCDDAADGSGDAVAQNATIHKIIPHILTGTALPYFPMGSVSNFIFHQKLDTLATSFSSESNIADMVDSDITISNIKYHYDVYKLKPPALSSIENRLVNGNYVLEVPDWKHQTHNLAANLTGCNVQLGFSLRKVKRLIIIARSTDRISVPLNKGLIGRNKAGITKILTKLDNRTFQNSSGIEMTASNSVEAYAELLKNNGGLLDMSTNSMVYDRFNLLGSGTAPTSLATSGSFYHEVDFSNGMDTDTSKSGVSIGNNNLEVQITKTGTEATTFDFFLEFYNIYTMNKNERVWRVDDAPQYAQ